MKRPLEILVINEDLARTLIANQFPEYAHLPIVSVEKQGHDNRTYRVGDSLLIRLPTAESYALKVPKEQNLLPRLSSSLSLPIPAPVKMGKASEIYPYPFSIYQWLEGRSLNLETLDENQKVVLAVDLANFLNELRSIVNVEGVSPGQHNWWRGDHVSVYDKGARDQISALSKEINSIKALSLWERACRTQWTQNPVWIHGDVAIGNLLVKRGKLSAVIDFGGMAVGDPACDLVMAWTYFSGKSREIFMKAIGVDEETWLRVKAWALWKATFELCQLTDRSSPETRRQKQIIEEVIM